MLGVAAVSIQQEPPEGGGENDETSSVKSDDSVTIIGDINMSQGGVDMIVANTGISDSESDSFSDDPPGPEAWWTFRCAHCDKYGFFYLCSDLCLLFVSVSKRTRLLRFSWFAIHSWLLNTRIH